MQDLTLWDSVRRKVGTPRGRPGQQVVFSRGPLFFFSFCAGGKYPTPSLLTAGFISLTHSQRLPVKPAHTHTHTNLYKKKKAFWERRGGNERKSDTSSQWQDGGGCFFFFFPVAVAAAKCDTDTKRSRTQVQYTITQQPAVNIKYTYHTSPNTTSSCAGVSDRIAVCCSISGEHVHVFLHAELDHFATTGKKNAL